MDSSARTCLQVTMTYRCMLMLEVNLETVNGWSRTLSGKLRFTYLRMESGSVLTSVTTGKIGLLCLNTKKRKSVAVSGSSVIHLSGSSVIQLNLTLQTTSSSLTSRLKVTRSLSTCCLRSTTITAESAMKLSSEVSHSLTGLLYTRLARSTLLSSDLASVMRARPSNSLFIC